MKYCSRVLSSPRAKRAGPKGLRAESARAVTGRRCPHSGVGEDFLGRRPGSPHENGHNLETKSRTIDPKMPKRAPRRGVQAPLCLKTGSHMKNGFSAKIRIFGANKKKHFCSLKYPFHMTLCTCGAEIYLPLRSWGVVVPVCVRSLALPPAN